jgi:hypothetical protein
MFDLSTPVRNAIAAIAGTLPAIVASLHVIIVVTPLTPI